MNTTRTATPRRSRLMRLAALAIGALSVTSFALVGSGNAASATSAPVATEAAHAQPPGHGARQRGDLCVKISGFRQRRDARDCGDNRLEVSLRRSDIRSFEATLRGRSRARICVGLMADRSNRWTIDCSNRGDRAEVDLRRGFAEAASLSIQGRNVCIQGGANGRWGRVNCNRNGFAIARAPRWGDNRLDSLRIWIRGR